MTSMFPSPIPDYDPYNTYKEPQQASRVNGKGVENYKKGQGSLNIGDWAVQSKDWSNSPRPVPRVKVEAENNFDKSQGSSMKELLTGYLDMPVAKKGPRVKKEAEENFVRSKGVVSDMCFKSYGKSDTKPNESSTNYNVTRGSNVAGLLHSYGALPPSARPVPRVKYEAINNAILDRGEEGSKAIHMVPPTSRQRLQSAAPRMSILW